MSVFSRDSYETFTLSMTLRKIKKGADHLDQGLYYSGSKMEVSGLSFYYRKIPALV